jgi:hypothetical protein
MHQFTAFFKSCFFQSGRRGSAADGVGHGWPGGVRRHHQGLLPRRPGVRARLLHHGQRLLRGGALMEEKGTTKITNDFF